MFGKKSAYQTLGSNREKAQYNDDSISEFQSDSDLCSSHTLPARGQDFEEASAANEQVKGLLLCALSVRESIFPRCFCNFECVSLLAM